MSARLGPVPGFPRWTGVVAEMSGPAAIQDGRAVFGVHVCLTRRGRWYARLRALRAKGGSGAAA